MERTPSLDAYALFVAVADAGGLSGAARATGVSVPTLSRRMNEFESALGVRLFSRGPRGYALTAQGRDLLKQAETLREVSSRLAAFAQTDRRVRVRITAGQWTSRFLARKVPGFWSPDDHWVPEFLASNSTVDIARREADIGIRNRRPDQNWLAGRRTVRIDYAAFALSPGVEGYVTLSEDTATTPSERWLRETHGDEIVTTANHARLALDLALCGVARMILPLFAARAHPELQRVGPVIDDIGHDEWLVCHHDARHDAPIRAAIDGVYAALTAPERRAAAR